MISQTIDCEAYIKCCASDPVDYCKIDLYYGLMSDIKILQSILDVQNLIRKDIKRVEEKVDKNGARINKLPLFESRGIL